MILLTSKSRNRKENYLLSFCFIFSDGLVKLHHVSSQLNARTHQDIDAKLAEAEERRKVSATLKEKLLLWRSDQASFYYSIHTLHPSAYFLFYNQIQTTPSTHLLFN